MDTTNLVKQWDEHKVIVSKLTALISNKNVFWRITKQSNIFTGPYFKTFLLVLYKNISQFAV